MKNLSNLELVGFVTIALVGYFKNEKICIYTLTTQITLPVSWLWGKEFGGYHTGLHELY